MTILPRFAIALVLSAGCVAHALADEYAIRVGTPLTGSVIPPGKIGLGIAVNIDKTWDELSPKDQQVWREFTELTDPQVTPPFPKPNIRFFLHRLESLFGLNYSDKLVQRDRILLVVRISEDGDVSGIDIMQGGTKGATALTDAEKVLAHGYTRALNATKFTPAMFNGKPAPSAFPMHIGFKITGQ